MKDLKIGDRILMTDTISEEEIYMSVGTVKEVCNSQFLKDHHTYYTIDFDKEVYMGCFDERLGIKDGHGRCIWDFDKYIKIEEGKYANEDFRIGDEVIIYNKRNMDKAVKVRINRFYGNKLLATDKDNYIYVAYKEDVLFLLKREEYRIGDIVIINDDFLKNTKAKIIDFRYFNTLFVTRAVCELLEETSYGWTDREYGKGRYWGVEFQECFPYEFNKITYEFDKINVPSVYNHVKIKYEEVKQEEGIVHDYDYIPDTFTFHKTNEEEHPLYFGLEIELSGKTTCEDEEDTKALLEKLPENEFYAIHDGSINGVEIVSHPMSYKHIQTINWDSFFQLAKELKYDNEDHCAGLHIHISRDWFEGHQSETLTKIVYLVYKYKCRITEEIADREPNCYCEYDHSTIEAVNDNDIFETYKQFSLKYDNEDGKYSAINIAHKDTYEFRVFDGVTNVSDLFKRVEFVYKLALVVRENDIYSIQNVTWKDIINKPIDEVKINF